MFRCGLSRTYKKDAAKSKMNAEPSVNVQNIPSTSFSTGDEEQPQVFTAVYGRYKPGKKHKSYEDDGFLYRKGRTIIIKDLKGNQVAREHSDRRDKEIESGDTIIISGLEVLVDQPIALEDYEKGCCFQLEYKVAVEKETTKVVKKNVSSSLFGLSRGNIPKSFACASGEGFTKKNSEMQVNRIYLPKIGVDDSEVPVWIEETVAQHLRQHQIEGVKKMYLGIMGTNGLGNGFILADEMGLGKTLQCIALVYTLSKQSFTGSPMRHNTLILAPSTLLKNWQNEFRKWVKDPRFNVYLADGKKKTVAHFLKQSERLNPVLLLSYELFLKHANRLNECSVQFDLLICDEGHRLKNSNSKLVKAISSMKVKKRILLTGTPIQNDLQELYNLCDLMSPCCLGRKEYFRKKFEIPILEGRKANASEQEIQESDEANQALGEIVSSMCIRRLQEDTIKKYLPSKVESILICRPSKLQTEIYQAILNYDDIVKSFGNFEKLPSSSLLPYITFLRKLCNHPFLVSEKLNKKNNLSEISLTRKLAPITDPIFNKYSHTLHQKSGKFDVLVKLLKLFRMLNQKVVIVSNFTQTLHLIAGYLRTQEYPHMQLDGSTPAQMRHQMVEAFNNPFSTFGAFLLSSKAGGCGLNLIGACNLIMYDIDWNPANDLQAMARIWRDGQEKTARIFRLITAGTIEEKILQRQIFKQGLSNTMQTFSSDIKFSSEELKDIFTINLNSLSTTHDALNCICFQNYNKEVESLEELSEEPQIDPDDESMYCELNDEEIIKEFSSDFTNLDEVNFDDILNDIDFDLIEDIDSVASDCETELHKKDLKEIDDYISSKKIKDIGIASLDKWQHFASPFENCYLETSLIEVKDLVSFIFRNEVTSLNDKTKQEE